MSSSITNQKSPSADLSRVAERFAEEYAGVLSERVYATLRKAILSGDLEPGTWMKETELTAILSISRTPLREALVRLTGEGLVTSSPNKGVVVRGVASKELMEIYQILAVLECFAVELAAKNVSEDQIQQLKHTLDLTAFFLERERWEDVTEQSVVFHSILYEASGNTELANLITALRQRAHAFRRFGIRTASHVHHGLNHHLAVMHAVENRDAAGAAEQMRQHIQSSIQLIQSVQISGADGVFDEVISGFTIVK